MATEKRLIEVLQSVYYLGGLEEILADKLIANDVVPVVRCKDCTHHCWDEFYGYYCTKIGKFVEPDFWCAYGKKKDNEV